MQWLRDPNQSNLDNFIHVRHEARRHFRNKKKEYPKAKLMNLKLTVRKKILGTCNRASMTLRRGYHTRTNVVKDEKVDLFADSHSGLARWRSYFFQLLNVQRVNIRRTE